MEVVNHAGVISGEEVHEHLQLDLRRDSGVLLSMEPHCKPFRGGTCRGRWKLVPTRKVMYTWCSDKDGPA